MGLNQRQDRYLLGFALLYTSAAYIQPIIATLAGSASVVHNASISGLAFHPTGNLHIAGGEDHIVRKVVPGGTIPL